MMKVFEQDLNIESLIKYAETEKLWIPRFQRPFFWENNQIRLLIDSLYHNYTISSILLWEGASELSHRRVGGSIREIKIPEENETKKTIYLLDGQQRTTALLLAFTDKAVYSGNRTQKKTIIDIFWDTEYQGDDPELRWILDDEKILDAENGNSHFILGELSPNEIFQKYRARFVKIKHVYNWSEISMKMLQEMNNDAELFVAYNKKVQELQKNILYRRVYDIEQQGSLEQVLEVFERINTKNTRLSIVDIMVAKTYRQIESNIFNLRSYLSLINYEGKVKDKYFENFEDDTELDAVKAKIDDSNMLAIIAILLKQEFVQTAVLKLKTEELMNNVKIIHDSFHQILAMLKQNFFIEEAELFKYQPMLKFLAGYCGHFKNMDLEKQTFLIRWFWNTLLKNRYPGAQSQRIARDLKLAIEKPLPVALKMMLKDATRNFDSINAATVDNPDYFDAYKSASSQQIYRAMLLLLKSKNARDFYNGLIPAKNAISKYTLEEHHIFPDNSVAGKQIKKKYSDHRLSDIINNIANIALLTKETNNNLIKAKNPSDYILTFEKEYQQQGKLEEFYSILDSQFISRDMVEMLKEDNFDAFIFSRTKELLKQIEKLCEIR